MELFLLYNKGKGESEHLSRNIRMFEKLGLKCESFRTFPLQMISRKTDFLYLNWYENLYNGIWPIAYCQYILKRLVLIAAGLRGIDIIVSQHNKSQHDTRHPCLSKVMFRAVYHSAAKIIVFSEEGKKDLAPYLPAADVRKKTYYIPPVNYIGAYPYVEHSWITKLRRPGVLTVLFVGSLNHSYKNVEMAIDIAKSLCEYQIQFIFAGKVSDERQREELRSRIGHCSHITGEFRYIRDDEMAQLLNISDIVLMPYNVESMSNSGTARLAFSYAKTVICPKIPSLEKIPGELIYTYTYKDHSGHGEQVRNCILRALSDFDRDRELLREKGHQLKTIMERDNSMDTILEKYKLLFSR